MEEDNKADLQLARNRLASDLRLKRIELDLKRKELEAKSKEGKLSGLSPLLTAIIAGAISIVGGVIANYYQGKHNLELERYKFDKNEELELQKQKHELVLKMIGTGDANQAAKNLLFLVNAGFIEDKDGRIAKLASDPNTIPVLPTLAAPGAPSETELRQRAVENVKQFEPILSNIQGGSKLGRAALDKAIQELRSGVWEEGNVNQGPLIQKYLSTVGLPQGMPWSAAFVSWCYAQVQNPPPFKPSGAWVSIREEFKSKGWLHEGSDYVPQPGDIMFITRVNSAIGHGGIVFHYENGTVDTIEGNVSVKGERTGNMVAAMKHKLMPNISFGHIPD